MRLELMAARPELYRADRKVDRLEQRVTKLAAENAMLKQRVKDLTRATRQADQPPAPAAALNQATDHPPTPQETRPQGGARSGPAADAGSH